MKKWDANHAIDVGTFTKLLLALTAISCLDVVDPLMENAVGENGFFFFFFFFFFVFSLALKY